MLVSSSPKTKNQKRKTAVVLASGGLDSCVAAAVARRDYDLALFHANYGQRTLMRELESFRAQAAFYQVVFTLEVDLNYLGEIGGSSLTDFDRAVPTDEVEPPRPTGWCCGRAHRWRGCPAVPPRQWARPGRNPSGWSRRSPPGS